MTRLLSIITLASLCWTIVAPTRADERGRGTPVTVTPLARWDRARVMDHLQSLGFETTRVKYGVDAYRVVYRTIGSNGSATVASSLVTVPRVDTRKLKLAAWMHGTTVYKGDAPSTLEDGEDRAVALLFAGAGYVTTAPDYLGLGVGPGTHPYGDRSTEVSASLDALRATHMIAEWLERKVDPAVAISGFSQGGAATIALARAIDGGADPRFRLGVVAPIAGPYDMSGTLASALKGDVAYAPAYLAYLIVAWNRVHYLYGSPSDAFLPPYDRTIESLFDNTHPAEEVLGALPERLDLLFTPAYLEQLATPSGALRDALDAADGICDFRASVPVHFYASAGDRDVPAANAQVCREALEARGTKATVTDFIDADHYGTLLRALSEVIEQLATR